MLLVGDGYGDIHGTGDGLFHDDTRILSRLRLSIAGKPLVLLGGAVGQDNVLFTAHLTNTSLPPLGEPLMPEAVVHVRRTRLLWRSRLYERVTPGQLRPRTSAGSPGPGIRRGLPRHVRGPRRPPSRAGTRHAVHRHRRGGDLATRGARWSPADLRDRFLPGTDQPDGSGRRCSRPRSPPHGRTDIFVEVGIEPADPPSQAALPHRLHPSALRHAFDRGSAAPPSAAPAACSTSGSASRAPIWHS